jgi:hypothetical protein
MRNYTLDPDARLRVSSNQLCHEVAAAARVLLFEEGSALSNVPEWVIPIEWAIYRGTTLCANHGLVGAIRRMADYLQWFGEPAQRPLRCEVMALWALTGFEIHQSSKAIAEYLDLESRTMRPDGAQCVTQDNTRGVTP